MFFSIYGLDHIVKFIKNNIHLYNIICLNGDLGVGKTLISKKIIQTISGITSVTSPTFCIHQNYNFKNKNISHFDLYRIKDVYQLYDIGFQEYIRTNICLIEWPDIALSLLNNYDYIYLNIMHHDILSRKISINFHKNQYNSLISI